MDSGRRRWRDGVQVDAVLRVVAMVAVVGVVDRLRVLLMSARCRGCRRGGRALEESLDSRLPDGKI